MKKLWKNLISSGKISKKLNRHTFPTIYFSVGFLIIIVIFFMFSQILIRSLRVDSTKGPALFANYIYNTKSYLDEAQKNYNEIVSNLETINKNYQQANKNSQLLVNIFDRWIKSLSGEGGEEEFLDYFTMEFSDDITFPVILTDNQKKPVNWKNLNIPEINYHDLQSVYKDSLNSMIEQMETIDVQVSGKVINYLFYLPLKNSIKEPPRPPKRFEDFIRSMEQPIIITNKNNNPIIWNNIKGISNNSDYSYLSIKEKNELMAAMNHMNAIPINSENVDIGKIYITELQAIRDLNIYTFLQLVLIILFVLIGYLGLKIIKRTENDFIWIGLAKETAHQLGTPITSLLGWIEYLKIRPEFKNPENEQMLDFMENDVDHLKKIASRFGKIGSQVELKPRELAPLLDQSVNYFRQRLPHLGKTISLELYNKVDDVKIKTEAELFGWVMENLLKNCVDALSDHGGKIIVTAEIKHNNVYIYVTDNGKGIHKHYLSKIFEAGVTTKKRGWGLGLSLVRRIIVDYHLGKIKVAKSIVNKGTTFEVILPIYREG